MKIKLKKFPIPWVSRGNTFTYYIKEKGQGISVYSDDFMSKNSEKEIVKYYKQRIRISTLSLITAKMWRLKVRFLGMSMIRGGE